MVVEMWMSCKDLLYGSYGNFCSRLNFVHELYVMKSIDLPVNCCRLNGKKIRSSTRLSRRRQHLQLDSAVAEDLSFCVFSLRRSFAQFCGGNQLSHTGSHRNIPYNPKFVDVFSPWNPQCYFCKTIWVHSLPFHRRRDY